MLCMNSYTQDYIDECRASMEKQLAAYKKLLAAGRAKTRTGFDSAVAVFEPLFFNNLVVDLGGFFVHRSRTIEGKDGNPLNQFRYHRYIALQKPWRDEYGKDQQIQPEQSIVKLRIGDEIKLTGPAFVALFKAFFAEFEAKFV